MTVANFALATDVGRRRSHNEDSIVGESPLFAVADGVGGAASGEDASQLALETLQEWSARIAEAPSDGQAVALMVEAVEHCNAAIHEAQLGDSERSGMGTTITAAVVRAAGTLVLGHVGDSRAYRIDGTGISQVTDDHSIVGELVRSGRIDAADAETHPQRNVITRALGPEPHVQVDTQVIRLAPGDWLLLCSDGLTGHVGEAEIELAVRGNASPQGAVDQLIDLANERGGSDNISVVLFQPLAAAGSGTGRMPAVDTLAAAVPTGLKATEISGELAVVPLDQVATPPAAEDTTTSMPPEWLGDPEVEDGEDHIDTSPLAAEPVDRRTRRREQARRNSRLRTLLIALVITSAAFLVGVFAWQQSYYVLERGDGTIGINHGFPVGALNTPLKRSDVQAENLSRRERTNLADRTLRNKADARKVFERLLEQAGACSAEAAGPTADGALSSGQRPDPQTATLPDPGCEA